MAEEKARAADWKNLAVLACTILVSLALCELAFRRMNGQPAFAWTNFRNTSVIRIQMSDGTRYDSNLGWAMIENKSRSGISVSTIDLGVRRNSAAHKLTRQGWNVAVGSSFAAGAEVRDEGAWPAQLEHLLGTPVDNGAVGGYAFDQVILRAEQLLEVLKPRLLIVEAMNESIDWVGYSSMVASKPYFTLVDGKLARHNNPVPIITRDGDRLDPIKTALGYSLMIDRAMATVFPDAWYASNTRSVRRIANDVVGVSCALLKRLKSLTDAKATRLIVFTNFGAGSIIGRDEPPQRVVRVERCARESGLQVVSMFPELRKAFEAGPGEFERYWVMNKGAHGHNSDYGNGAVARLVAAAIEDPALNIISARVAGSAWLRGEVRLQGGGINLLAGADEKSMQLAAAGIERSSDKGPLAREPVLRLAPKGSKGEHYAVIPWAAPTAGQTAFSIYVRRSTTASVRLQLLDEQVNGLIVDHALATDAFESTRVGKATNLDVQVEKSSGDWHRITVSASLPAKTGKVIIQLADPNGSTDFTGSTVALLFQAPMVETGGTASAWCRPGACPAAAKAP